MNHSSRSRGGDGTVSALIRDQLHDAANRQFLSRLPVFCPDNDTDSVFDELLAKLERAEGARR